MSHSSPGAFAHQREKLLHEESLAKEEKILGSYGVCDGVCGSTYSILLFAIELFQTHGLWGFWPVIQRTTCLGLCVEIVRSRAVACAASTRGWGCCYP